jgi:hypothetical protein
MTAYGHVDGRHRVQCSRRVQTKDCDAPTFFAEIVEEQIGTFLQGFAVPESERARLVAAWQERQRQSSKGGQKRERSRLERTLVRLRELYLEGDIDGTEYRKRKAALTAELAALPSSDAPASDIGQRLAAYLAEIALAWQIATPEERNKLARQMFNSVTIENRTAVEITPRPDLLPFFAVLAAESSNVMTYGRKRRGSLTRDRCCYPALRPLLVSRATAPLTATIWGWPLRRRGQRTTYPKGAMVRGRGSG